MPDSFDDLLEQFSGPRLPGQPRLPVRIDPERRALELCGIERAAAPGTGNRGLLEAFVDLVEAVRAMRPASVQQLRRIDLLALAAVLDLSDDDLERDLAAILGISEARANAVADRLQRAGRMRRADRLNGIKSPHER